MDFWASLEHTIYYKYAPTSRRRCCASSREAAETAASLDSQMERLHTQTHPVAVTGSALPS